MLRLRTTTTAPSVDTEGGGIPKSDDEQLRREFVRTLSVLQSESCRCDVLRLCSILAWDPFAPAGEDGPKFEAPACHVVELLATLPSLKLLCIAYIVLVSSLSILVWRRVVTESHETSTVGACVFISRCTCSTDAASF